MKSDEIVIKIKRRRRRINRAVSSPVVSSNNGILTARRESDYQARRTRPETYLNFYDLGQIKNEAGEWIDLDFTVNHGVDGDYNHPYPFTTADQTAFEDRLFSIPLADWETGYRKFEFADADSYGLRVFFDQPVATEFDTRLSAMNSLWTPKGLKAKGKLLAEGAAFTFFDLHETEKTKITASRDPDAPPREFSFKSNASVFLVPSLAYRSALGIYGESAQRVNAGYGIISRQLFRDIPSYHYSGADLRRAPFFLFYGGNYEFTTDDPAYGLFLSAGVTTGYIARGFAARISELYAAYPGTATDTSTLDGFPPPHSSGGYEYGLPANRQTVIARRALSAVIKTGGEIYYVWTELRDEDRSTIRFNFLFS